MVPNVIELKEEMVRSRGQGEVVVLAYRRMVSSTRKLGSTNNW